MKLYLIAGEPSGDRLGAALMAGLKELAPEITFQGIGGPLMQAQGLTSLFEMHELSVMGLAEILPKLPGLLRRRDEAVADVLGSDAAALITIDSPDFCLRVARKVKAASDLPTIHYVAPTVWAWRPKRADRMRGVIDHVLALFPFEPPYMEAAGISCDFVGHPVTSEPVATDAEARALRAEAGIADAPMILALPGSRVGEVRRLSAVFEAVLRPVIETIPQARVVIPAMDVVADLVTERAAHWPGDPVVLDPRGLEPGRALARKRAAFKAADGALAASGTVSLELAASETPMVIAYDMNWLSRKMIKRLLRVDSVTLVNLVSGGRSVPEFIGDDCRPDLIAPALLDVLRDGSAQRDACRETMRRLGRGGAPPGLRAARCVLTALART